MMNQEDIIRMAREAGFSEQDGIITGGVSDLERFAELIAAAERKAIGFDKAELWIKRINDAVLAEREACAEAAADAVAFNGGTVQMEAHVRQAIRARSEK